MFNLDNYVIIGSLSFHNKEENYIKWSLYKSMSHTKKYPSTSAITIIEVYKHKPEIRYIAVLKTYWLLDALSAVIFMEYIHFFASNIINYRHFSIDRLERP